MSVEGYWSIWIQRYVLNYRLVYIHSRVSQIAGVFQKMIFESCTLYHIMPFAKIIGPVEKKITKSWF